MRRFLTFAAVALLAVLGGGATCSPSAPDAEVTAERAIEIARPHVTFEIASERTERATDEGRPVWKVTFRGRPSSPDLPELSALLIVFVDRRSGEVVSIAQS